MYMDDRRWSPYLGPRLAGSLSLHQRHEITNNML